MGAKITANFLLNSNWAVTDTCFKRNNGRSPIVADHPRQAFPLKDRNGRESRTKFYCPDHPDPSSPTVQTQCRVFSYDL